MTDTLAYLLLVYGSLLPLCLHHLRKPSKKSRKLIAWSMLVVLYGVIPFWIFIGGIDCAPPDDADLIIPLRDKPFEGDGNGWVMLTNAFEQLGAYDELLWWYVDPENCTFPEDLNVLASFTNAVTYRTYIEAHLKSNELLLAGIDAAIAAPTYDPPLVPPESLCEDRESLPLRALFDAHRGVLQARVKCAIETGDFDAAIEYFGRNLRLDTLLQTRCNCFLDYLAGTALCRHDVELLGRVLDDSAIPVEKLRKFDELLKDIPGISPGAIAHALKLDYTYCRELCMKRRVDIMFPEESSFTKLLLRPYARYAFNPNRVLRTKAKSIRDTLHGEATENGKCERRERRWQDILIPNSFGRHTEYSCYLNRAKESALKEVASVRRKISERIIAQQTNAKYVVGSQWFPLVFTNGCYYTHDLKKIISFSPSLKSIVVDGDVTLPHSMSSDDFENLRTIVVPRGCETWLEEWDFVFRAPVDLKEVVVAEDNPEIGISGGVLYDRKTMRLLNLIGDKKTIVMPKDVIVDWKNWPRNSLRAKGVERLHFCGPLPDFRSRSDSFAGRIERWWEYKSWRNFKRIVQRPVRKGMLSHASSNLVVTVSHENADERTKSIVESGLWEGRRISWGEP